MYIPQPSHLVTYIVSATSAAGGQIHFYNESVRQLDEMLQPAVICGFTEAHCDCLECVNFRNKKLYQREEGSHTVTLSHCHCRQV